MAHPGYATPKIDVRAAVIKDGKILLVQETTDNCWAMPGGWADVGDVPSEVRVTVEECNRNTGVCYPDKQNVTMALVSSSIYRTDVTLKHSDATYITINVVAKINGVWQQSAGKEVNLSAANGNNGDDNGIPGFEAVVFVLAISMSFILISRKRCK